MTGRRANDKEREKKRQSQYERGYLVLVCTDRLLIGMYPSRYTGTGGMNRVKRTRHLGVHPLRITAEHHIIRPRIVQNARTQE